VGIELRTGAQVELAAKGVAQTHDAVGMTARLAVPHVQRVRKRGGQFQHEAFAFPDEPGVLKRGVGLLREQAQRVGQ